MTVSENLDIGGHRLNDNVRAGRREWLFDLFPVLKERRSQTAATLSGGEQQMLTIARPDDEARPLDAHRSRMSRVARVAPSPRSRPAPDRPLPTERRGFAERLERARGVAVEPIEVEPQRPERNERGQDRRV
jgi:hypothetical protein